MNQVKTGEVLEILNTEIAKIQVNAKITDDASKQRLTGWSAAGDKYHAQAAADLTKSYLKRLELLKGELEKAPAGTSKIIKPPCFVRIVFTDGEVCDLFLVKNAVSLPNASFISEESPLGKAVLGKVNGDPFSYELNDGKKYSGKIIALE